MNEVKKDLGKFDRTFYRYPRLNIYQMLLLNALNEAAKEKSLVTIPEICRGQGNSYGIARFAEYHDLIVITPSETAKKFFSVHQEFNGKIYHVRELFARGIDLSKGFVFDSGVKLEDIKDFKHNLVTGLTPVKNTYTKF